MAYDFRTVYSTADDNTGDDGRVDQLENVTHSARVANGTAGAAKDQDGISVVEAAQLLQWR
jgi:hypothetical protein